MVGFGIVEGGMLGLGILKGIVEGILGNAVYNRLQGDIKDVIKSVIYEAQKEYIKKYNIIAGDDFLSYVDNAEKLIEWICNENIFSCHPPRFNRVDDIEQINFVAEAIRELVMKDERLLAYLSHKNSILSNRETPTIIPHLITLQAPTISKEFSYRDDMVEELYEAIKQNKKLALINGLGGIGKTSVAKALYHKIKDECKHVAWVEYQHSIRDSLLNSFKVFDDDINDSDQRYRRIERFLLDATKDTIIFIDNVSNDDSVGVDFIERLSANVVLTSRLDHIGNFEVFPVGFLSEEQCVDIFYKFYKHDKLRKHEKIVRELVELVKCHTYSVELLARTANKPGYPLETYLADLKEKGFEYPSLNVKTEYNKNSKTIAGHLITLFELVSVSDEQKRILKNFSLMPSVEIPFEVEKWIDCSINDLMKIVELGWLAMSETGYEMHPMIKEAIRLQYKEIKSEDFKEIIYYMSSDEYINDGDIYTKVHARLNIAESVMNHFCGIEKEKIGILFINIAVLYFHQGDYLKALEWNQKALKICEKVLGLEHPSTAATYSNIALVYDNQGDYLKALEWNQKALKIREKVLGLEHPSTATTYNNIAGVYSRQGDYPKALEWYEKALEIDEKVLGLEHPDTATTYNNIAAVYDKKGDYPKALKWNHKALEIREKVLGLEHPSAAATYNNIALVYFKQGDYPKALEWYEKALKICEKVLGLEHPYTATTYNNIAIVYSKQGDYPKALEWHEKALEIKEKVLGLEHPSIATAYNNIAGVYDNQGDYPKALEWYQKALEIDEKVLGLEHPDTATTYNNIAGVYDNQGDYLKALEWYQKALEINEKVLGVEHPYTIETYKGIARINDRE